MKNQIVVAICEMEFDALKLIGCPILYPNVCQLMVEGNQGMDYTNEKISMHMNNFFLSLSVFTRIMGVKDGGTNVDLSGDMRSKLFQCVTKFLAADNGEIMMYSLKKIVLERTADDILFKITYILFAMAALLCP